MAEKKKTVDAPASAGSVRDEAGRKKALDEAIKRIERDYGKGTIMRLGDDLPVNVEALSTGSLTLDLALGIGGVPRGRIVEIYGPEASGKTTLALHIAASAQKSGGEAAYIDVEHALEPAYARALGVDIDSLLISQPDTGEQALDIAESLVRSGAVDVVVVDSVAALIPRTELEGEIGDSVVGVLARLMSQAMRRLAGAISKNNCTVIFINQLRQKIGVMYGNPETTPGGLALKYYASVRIDVRRVESLKAGGEIIGNHTRAKVVKNKVAPPFREAEFDIMYGEGISRIGEIVDLGVKLELIDKGGAWFTVEGNRIQGRDGVKQYLRWQSMSVRMILQRAERNLLKPVPYEKCAPAVCRARNPDTDGCPYPGFVFSNSLLCVRYYLAFCCNGLNLAEELLRQLAHCDTAAGGLADKVFCVHGVECCEVLHIGKEAGRLDDILKADSGRFQERTNILAALFRLFLDGVADDLPC